MKHVLYYLIVGSRGGETRARIIEALIKNPCNAHKLSERLKLDYKTIQHHLNLLEKHRVLVKAGKYGAVYFLNENIKEFWKKFRKKGHNWD